MFSPPKSVAATSSSSLACSAASEVAPAKHRPGTSSLVQMTLRGLADDAQPRPPEFAGRSAHDLSGDKIGRATTTLVHRMKWSPSPTTSRRSRTGSTVPRTTASTDRGALTAMIVLLLTAGCVAGRDRLGRTAG
jgi:hypothetical protein